MRNHRVQHHAPVSCPTADRRSLRSAPSVPRSQRFHRFPQAALFLSLHLHPCSAMLAHFSSMGRHARAVCRHASGMPLHRRLARASAQALSLTRIWPCLPAAATITTHLDAAATCPLGVFIYIQRPSGPYCAGPGWSHGTRPSLARVAWRPLSVPLTVTLPFCSQPVA